MKTSIILAVSSLLSVAAAFPLEKRVLVWSTVVDLVVETEIITRTVWAAPGSLTTLSSSASTPDTTVSTASPPSSTPTPSPVSSSLVLLQAPPASTEQPAAAVHLPSVVPAAAVIPASTPVVAPLPPATTVSTAVIVPSPSPSSPPTTGSSSSASHNTYVVETLPGATVPDGPCTPESPCNGTMTYYTPGLGACGVTSTVDDMIVAVPVQQMGSLSNGEVMNALCGRKVVITGPCGKTATATVVDKCQDCKSDYSLDLSPAVFNAVCGGNGLIPGTTWYWA